MSNNNSNTTIQNFATEVDDSLSNSKSVQNDVPLMIEHINRYGEDLKIWGMPVRNVTIVAIVDCVDVVSTRVNFKFHDETGSLNGVKWLDTDSYECPVKINSYAKVYGHMRRQNDENYILVMTIQPIEHLNELLAHLMEVTFVCLKREDESIQAAQNRSTNNYTSGERFNSSASTAVLSDFNAYANDLNADQNLIMDIIARGHPEDGAERSAIKCQVPIYLTPKVDGILEFLSSEGHIYTTKTDDHFKKL